jgi:hypothetical protein
MSEPFIDFLCTWSHRVNYEMLKKILTRYNFNLISHGLKDFSLLKEKSITDVQG